MSSKPSRQRNSTSGPPQKSNKASNSSPEFPPASKTAPALSIPAPSSPASTSASPKGPKHSRNSNRQTIGAKLECAQTMMRAQEALIYTEKYLGLNLNRPIED